MTFKEAIQTCLQKKYVSFEGRAARSEYWWFALFCFIVTFVAIVVDNVLGTSFGAGIYGIAYLVVALGLFLPSLAVSVRRLHDKDKSGWWYLLVLVPLIGPIVLLVWFVTRGTTGSNKYGPDPLQPGASVFS